MRMNTKCQICGKPLLDAHRKKTCLKECEIQCVKNREHIRLRFDRKEMREFFIMNCF